MPPPIVETAQAVDRPWTVTYAATGTLEANNKVDLNAEVAGNIQSILVREGQFVRQGQVLMQLKSDKQLAQAQEAAAGISASLGNIQQQQADIQQAKARLQSAQTRRNLAESELKRYEKLYQEQFISQLELDQKRTAHDTALAAYNEAVQALSSAQARSSQASSNLAQARSNYRYNVALTRESSVRAPFSGVVGQRYLDLGDYAAPGQKLLTLVDPSRFNIQFTVPERFLGEIHTGLPVKVLFEALGNTSFMGTVNFIDPVVDANSHTITLKAVIPGSERLRHGLLGTVALSLGVIPHAVVIPEEAIVPQGDKTFVYVVLNEVPPAPPKADGKPAVAPVSNKRANIAHLREVHVGYREAGQVQIQSGLQPGDAVIIHGLQKVNDSQEVNVSAPGAVSSATTETGKGH